MRISTAAAAGIWAAALALPAAAQGIGPGTYRCFVYLNNIPTLVGTIRLDGRSYSVHGQNAAGTYATAAGVTTFNGPPPLGFKAAAPVAAEPGRFRLYPDAGAVGKAWRAALCSPAT